MRTPIPNFVYSQPQSPHVILSPEVINLYPKKMNKTFKRLYTALALIAISTVAIAQQPATGEPEEQQPAPDDYKFRFGGYGEMVAAFKDYGTNRYYGSKTGNTKDNRATISIPRFVIAFDYKFTPKWVLSAEIEFEAGGTGSEVELENSENGEWETEVEQGGEVALEQFHITYNFCPWFNVRAGHVIIPVSLTNSHHEPIYFFGTVRPEGETTIIPSTWHETGLELFGNAGSGLGSFDYTLQVVTGLNVDGFDRNEWVKGGKQGLFEDDNFSSPAWVARLNWTGVQDLRIGASFYRVNDVTKNADKPHKYSSVGKSSINIWSADAQYMNEYVTFRFNVLGGLLENADGITGVVSKLSNNSPYSRTGAVAKRALAYGGEVGLNLGSLINRFPVVYPFARYEYYNSQESGAGMTTMDKRCQVSMWTWGLNWFALPNLVFKLDYTNREIGTSKVFGEGQYTGENEFAIGIAYIGWFTRN